ncbi:hypothetical protein RB595_005537 [Gaeumannomyces hyphopodioides]
MMTSEDRERERLDGWEQTQRDHARRRQVRREKAAEWEEALMKPKRIPFTTEEPLVGPPRYSWADLRKPLLRKCPFDLKDICWQQHLGGGYDGWCWKVSFGDQGLFVLKLFWDAKPPRGSMTWPTQREFQNNAVLQMVEASLNDLEDGQSIHLRSHLENRTDAIENLYAFSQEARQKPRIKADAETTVTLDAMRRTRKCFGWLKLSGEYFRDPTRHDMAPRGVKVGKWQRGLRPDPAEEYFALVYEYIPEQKTDKHELVDRDEIQASMDFLALVGFEFLDSTILDNWKSGVLIDLSDIVFPLGYGKWKDHHTYGNAKCLQAQAPTVHRIVLGQRLE